MNTHATRASENKSQAVADSLTKQQISGESIFQFEDNRPELIVPGIMHEAANGSSRVQQLKAYQAMANNSSNVKQLRSYQAMADNYTVQTAQRKETPAEFPLQGKFGHDQKKENKTGLSDSLKTGMENLSAMSLDDVKVHRDSGKPAQLAKQENETIPPLQMQTGKFIMDDGQQVEEGRVSKAEFLAELRARVNVVSEQILSPFGMGQSDCPDLMYWISYYESKEADYIEQAIARYAPETAGAGNWNQYLALLVKRIETGLIEHTRTGKVIDPEPMPASIDQKRPPLSVFGIGGRGELVAQLRCGSDENKPPKKPVKKADVPDQKAEIDDRLVTFADVNKAIGPKVQDDIKDDGNPEHLWAHLGGEEKGVMKDFWDKCGPDIQARIVAVLKTKNHELKMSRFSDIMEAIDPNHGQAIKLDKVKAWLKGGEAGKEVLAGESLFAWMDRFSGPMRKGTRYDDEKARREVQVVVEGGQLVRNNKDKVDGVDMAVVLTSADELYGAGKGGGDVKKQVHHSTFMEGLPVKSAGSMVVTAGTLKKVSNYSGHYKAERWHLAVLLNAFGSKGVDMGGVAVQEVKPDEELVNHANTDAFYRTLVPK